MPAEPSSDEESSSLIPLQSPDHEQILYTIDQLRHEGISKFVSLPQLIVCGDQSSGKSSVLEAISGLAFPQKDNLCTRFATELILRRSSTISVTASIHPDPDRPQNEQRRIKSFDIRGASLTNFRKIVIDAEARIIGTGKDSKPFAKDILRVEVTGPKQPHLTLVDLPGLYHAPDEFQSEAGVKFVESLAYSYIRNKRSMILAVISAKSDIALQKVTAFTRKVDPHGHRTMGIITKPDKLDRASEMERSFVDLARNSRMALRLGWHVLKNRSFEEQHFDLEQRRESEIAFFGAGIWSTIPRSQVGIDNLRPRLSATLKDHIVAQIPSLMSETQGILQDTSEQLGKLGEARRSLADQRQYLLDRSERISSLLKYASDGYYFDSFFGNSMDDLGFQKRIRAVVQGRLLDFAEEIKKNGEQQKIVEADTFVGKSGRVITRDQYVTEVRERQRRARGRELPGMFNPLLVGELFYLQSQPWQKITNACLEDVMGSVRCTIRLILEDAMDNSSADGVLRLVIGPRLAEIEKALQQKTLELLRPQQTGHPITYNRQFVVAVQEARSLHQRQATLARLKSFFGPSFDEDVLHETNYKFGPREFINAITIQSEEDMELFACNEMVYCMQAYYEVAIDKYIDDFSKLGVENCLMEPLVEILKPQVVSRLADDVVEAIAAENEATLAERHRLQEKVEILQKSIDKLRPLSRLNLKGK